MEEIAKALQDLQGELAASRQDYATLSAQVRSLAAQTAPLPTQPPTPVQVHVSPEAIVPLAPPERYAGDPQKFTTFITQCRLHFLTKTAAFRSVQSRTAFVISYLTGDAAAWANPLVQKDHAILYDWDDFLAEFEKIFNRRAATLCKDQELLSLKQGSKELVTYVTHFNRLVAEADWPHDKQMSLFYQGLRDDIKDLIAQVDPQPRECSEMIDLALRLDHRMAERRGDRRKGDSRPVPRLDLYKGSRGVAAKSEGDEPMQIGSVRGPLTKEEKEQRRKDGLCMYCGKAGHFVRECPSKPKTQGNASARR